MCEMLKKVSWKNVLLGGLAFLVISTVLRWVEAALTMKYYLMPQYFPVWSKLMMPTAGPPPASFMLWSAVFALFSGLALAFCYEAIHDALPKKYWQNVCSFTFILSLLSFCIFTLSVRLLINLPGSLLVWWFVTGVVIYFLSALVFVKLKR